MRSYLRAPHIHREALLDPAMHGGPFVDLDGECAAEVEELITRTEACQSKLLQLADAIRDIERLLLEANGAPLDPFYSRIPKPLAGFVELAYDLRHRPRLRFLEPLLYASEHYDSRLQSIIMCRPQDKRPFILSTPAIKPAFEIQVPFDADALRSLANARFEAVDPITLAGSLGIEDIDSFLKFFTNKAPRRLPQAKSLRIRFFGHATVLIETGTVTILVDPILPYGCDQDRFGFGDLPEWIDYVILSHTHSDHTSIETLLAIATRVGTVVVPTGGGELFDPGLAPMMRRLGFASVREIGMLESLPLGHCVELVSLPFLGEHSDLDVRSKHVPLIRTDGYTMIFATDLRCPDPSVYRHVKSLVGDINWLFVGLESRGAPLSWLYGPLFPEPPNREVDESRRVNAADAALALGIVDLLRPQRAFVYALGVEPWLTHLTGGGTTGERARTEAAKFVKGCKARGIDGEILEGFAEIIS